MLVRYGVQIRQYSYPREWSRFSSPAVTWTRIDDSSWSSKLLKASNILLAPAWLVPSCTLMKTTCSIPCWKSCQPHNSSLLAFFHFLFLHSIRGTSPASHGWSLNDKGNQEKVAASKYPSKFLKTYTLTAQCFPGGKSSIVTRITRHS